MGRQRRFFRYGELPLVLLSLLEQQPLRGFDVMAELDRLFGPDYQASAGSVYPALKALESEGLVERSDFDDQHYQLTPTGRDSLDKRRAMLTALEDRTRVRLTSVGDLSVVLKRFTARIEPLAGRVDVDLVEEVLDEAATRIGCLPRPAGRANDG